MLTIVCLMNVKNLFRQKVKVIRQAIDLFWRNRMTFIFHALPWLAGMGSLLYVAVALVKPEWFL